MNISSMPNNPHENLNMQPGDHLFIRRGILGRSGQYTHHGVYVGAGQVIHYAGFANGFSLASRPIELAGLDTFDDGEQVQIKPYAIRPFNHTEAVIRAKSRLWENNYNLLFNNCEHFASWCCIGEKHSAQLRSLAKKASTVSIVVAALVLSNTPTGRKALKAATRTAKNILDDAGQKRC
jgi:hypothetical protein